MTDLTFRFAERKDIPLILRFIKELADYEGLLSEVVATEEILETWIFDKEKAEVLLAVDKSGEEIGFALFFHNFSTFLGRAGIYLEDLYVSPVHRGKGYGKAILQKLAQIAVERGCGRLEWWCLDTNTPSIGFYLSLGAEPMSDWTVYRLAGDTLKKWQKIKHKKKQKIPLMEIFCFFYFKRISRTRKNANDPKVTSRNNGKNCGGRFPPKAD